MKAEDVVQRALMEKRKGGLSFHKSVDWQQEEYAQRVRNQVDDEELQRFARAHRGHFKIRTAGVGATGTSIWANYGIAKTVAISDDLKKYIDMDEWAAAAKRSNAKAVFADVFSCPCCTDVEEVAASDAGYDDPVIRPSYSSRLA